MRHYLIYWDENAVNETKAINAILAETNAKGFTMMAADFNLHVCITDASGSEVHDILSRHLPKDANFFIASVSNVGFRGDAQFGAAFKRLAENSSAD